MQNNHISKRLKIREFISIASQLALVACQITKQTSQNPNLGKYQKSFDDPVTQADYKIQTMIINGLNYYFPDLKIIGQQTVDYKGQINVDYTKFKLDFYPQNNKFKQLQVDYSQLCVWIDPIDCTKGFIAKKTQYVTTLIGMSRNKQAYVGVVGKAFTKINQTTRIFVPSASVGVVETKQAYKYTENTKWIKYTLPKPNNPLLVTTSRQRADNTFYEYVKFINGKEVFAGGAGNKIMMVIDGTADILAYLDSYTCKWDTCAGEAILKAMGGYLTTTTGQSLVYDPFAEHFNNQFGQIGTFDIKLLQSVKQFYRTKSQVPKKQKYVQKKP